MTVTSVGMRCPECARQTTKVRTIRSSANRGYEATKVLIAINVIAFLAEGSAVFTLTGLAGNSWLLNHGFLEAPFVRSAQALLPFPAHEYYRLVTSGFLHLSLLHIASNMYVLYWVGRLLEPAIGRVRFLAIYFTGLFAGALGVLIVSPLTATAGASGAIFGLLGAAFVEAHRRGIEAVRNQLVMLIVLNLIITVSIPGISIGGHIGGLIGGGLATLAFRVGVIAVVASIVVANHTSLM